MVNKKIQIDSINPYWNIKVSFILLFLLIFIVVSVLAITGITGNLDEIVIEFVNQIRSQTLDIVFIIITTTSDTINLIIVGFILRSLPTVPGQRRRYPRIPPAPPKFVDS